LINWLGPGFSETLGWGFPPERFAWSAIETGGDGGEVCSAMAGQIGGERVV
jgi:hypothetical protein